MTHHEATAKEFFEAMDTVMDALRYAENKHPKFPVDRYHQLAILTEEVGECHKAALENDEQEYLHEVAQVAAVCIRILTLIPATSKDLPPV